MEAVVCCGVRLCRLRLPFTGSPCTWPPRSRGLEDTSRPVTFSITFERLPPLLQGLGTVIVSVSAFGAWSAFRSRPRSAEDLEQVTDLKVAAAWVVSFYLFQLVFPITDAQVQYLLPIVPAILFLFTRGFSLLQEWLVRWSRPVRYAFAGVTLLLIFLPQPLRALHPVHGYDAVIDTIPPHAGTVILVSSGTIGEGAVVVEQRLRDPQRQVFVLRGSKVLGTSAWNGRSYQPCFHTTGEIQEYLNRVPVHFIILDDFGYSREPKDPHHELLRQTLESCPGNFVLLGRFPVATPTRLFESGILLYENSRARGRRPEGIHLDLSRILGRELAPSHIPALEHGTSRG